MMVKKETAGPGSWLGFSSVTFWLQVTESNKALPYLSVAQGSQLQQMQRGELHLTSSFPNQVAMVLSVPR